MSAALSNQAAARQLLNFFYDSMDTLWVWAGTQQENVRNKDISEIHLKIFVRIFRNKQKPYFFLSVRFTPDG